MRVEVHHRCSDFASYRAARVKSLFNVERGCNFDLTAELPIDDGDWRLGLIVGPSGSGKTSLGGRVFGEEAFYRPDGWATDRPLVDCIAPDGSFDAVTAALAAVGLGSVPTWLRPYPVLSNGEPFRADLARVICEAPDRVVIDEFTSVVDRQIARFGALAFAKAWKRTKEQCVLLSCHRDIVEWVEPDWVFDTATGKFSGRGLWRRPRFELEVRVGSWELWPLFEPHHYLKLPKMVAGKCYVGFVEGEPVVHLGVSTAHTGLGVEARACRLVVMPERQGAGVGMRFLNHVCALQLQGRGRIPGRKLTTLFHTSHPGLAAALRRDPQWRQVSCSTHGARKAQTRGACGGRARCARPATAGTSGQCRGSGSTVRPEWITRERRPRGRGAGEGDDVALHAHSRPSLHRTWQRSPRSRVPFCARPWVGTVEQVEQVERGALPGSVPATPPTWVRARPALWHRGSPKPPSSGEKHG